MTLFQRIITIALCVVGTMATRFLPFLIFRSRQSTPRYVQYLGRALPSAIFSMLVVYCLKDVSLFSGGHGLPEAIALAATVALHLCFRKMLISIAAGTVCYMILVQFVFLGA